MSTFTLADRQAQTLHMHPHYPVTPWQWAETILPGDLVEVQEYSGIWRGLAHAFTITATKASVTQTLEIERRYPV
ncbi:hypothetical protein LRB11_15365 [Ectothiorhodospira haloalkaliphila]|uniref:hypothetical protein n=1 Tax=Ectothiorhodospira haloalkaliphila TaxID=421628 RepID=UPI001EE7C4E5|nr:hypothetical protein [Ectothiorhodospira haloalkaliphila]MCG5526294.1 hypothetical protein [Ectothiorhodospira haloalkaliphila]